MNKEQRNFYWKDYIKQWLQRDIEETCMRQPFMEDEDLNGEAGQ